MAPWASDRFADKAPAAELWPLLQTSEMQR